jgi:hypothetical protein
MGIVYKTHGCYPRVMQKIKVLLAALVLGLLSSPGAIASNSCVALNTPAVADDELTVTLTSITITEKSGSNQLSISYKLMNATPDKKLNEGSFKLFFTDGSSEPQYGFFGSFFPGDSRERSYTWEYLKSKTPMDISYNAGFFSTTPSSSKLNWAPPGQDCDLGTAASEKAAADKAAADRLAAQKAAADKAAADKAAAEKALADKIAAEKAAAESAATLAAVAAAVDGVNASVDAANKAIAETLSKINDVKKTSPKLKSITCTKGNLRKKVTSNKPVCPVGYKKR